MSTKETTTKRPKKLSQDYVSDSEEEGGKSPSLISTTGEDTSKLNDDGERYFDLSSKRRITVRKWKNNKLIDIREFWGDDNDLKPGKKGISLSIEQWNQLVKLAPAIDKILAKLE